MSRVGITSANKQTADPVTINQVKETQVVTPAKNSMPNKAKANICKGNSDKPSSQVVHGSKRSV